MISIEFYYDNEEIFVYYSSNPIYYVPRIGEKVELKDVLYRVIDIKHSLEIIDEIASNNMEQVITIELTRRWDYK